MKGHTKTLCQLRSPSEEPRPLGSIFEDTATIASLPSTPPLTPTPSSRTIMNPRLSSMSVYPNKPISLEPSWEAPPDGTFYHRRNPYIVNPLTLSEVARDNPLRRTASWISTEKAESEFGDRDDSYDDCFSSTLKSVTSVNAARSRFTPARANTATLPLTPPTTPANSQNTANRITHHAERQVDVIDAAGNKVVGLDLSTLNENIKSIIRQADLAGYYATIVRPRIGYTRGSVDIRTNEDADKHTTVFVSTGPDTMSINLVCSEAFRKAKLMNEASGACVNTKSWCLVFFAMFFASLIAFWASLFVIRTLW